MGFDFLSFLPSAHFTCYVFNDDIIRYDIYLDEISAIVKKFLVDCFDTFCFLWNYWSGQHISRAMPL